MNPPSTSTSTSTTQWTEDPLTAFTTLDQLFEPDHPTYHALPHLATNGFPPPRFDIDQEVFILDSNGTDPTGLSTYLVQTNHERDHAGQFLYRLIPCQNVAFRAAEARLLGVHFPLGAQVRRKGDPMASIVTKRYVVRGQRLYDLRDEVGERVMGVKEEELSAELGGRFSFVTPVAWSNDGLGRD